MNKQDTVIVKITGPRELVELTLSQLESFYQMTMASPIKTNKEDSNVHVFMTVNPKTLHKVKVLAK
jgi:hypothetical protein